MSVLQWHVYFQKALSDCFPSLLLTALSSLSESIVTELDVFENSLVLRTDSSAALCLAPHQSFGVEHPTVCLLGALQGREQQQLLQSCTSTLSPVFCNACFLICTPTLSVIFGLEHQLGIVVPSPQSKICLPPQCSYFQAFCFSHFCLWRRRQKSSSTRAIQTSCEYLHLPPFSAPLLCNPLHKAPHFPPLAEICAGWSAAEVSGGGWFGFFPPVLILKELTCA